MQEREAAGVLRDTAAIRTPFYVVDETLLKKNLEILKDTAERAGCRILLAQKAFSMYSVYPLIRQYLSGTAASGLYEAAFASKSSTVFTSRSSKSRALFFLSSFWYSR